MYIHNNPTRRNERRMGALKRLGKRLADTPERKEAIVAESAVLQARILPVATTMTIRTKKDRSARGKFR